MADTTESVIPNIDFGLESNLDVKIALFLLPLITILGFFIPLLYLYPPVPASKAEALQPTHVRLGLSRDESNLRDQLSSRHRGDVTTGKPPQAKLQALSIYPIKSCRGIELSRSRVLPTGLEFDRFYTFAQLKSPFPVASDATEEEKAKGHTWEFITQRQFPLLANVKVDVWIPNAASPGSDPSATKAAKKGEEAISEPWLVVRFPWKECGMKGLWQTLAAKAGRGWHAVPEKEILLPVHFPLEQDIVERGYTFEDVKIWKEVVTALNVGSELPEELRLYLGVSNRLGLFRSDPEHLRQVYRCAPKRDEAGYQPIVGFQDAYPLHLMNLASLQDLDSLIAKDEDLKELDVRRFRSNIIVTGVPAYDEETWKSVRFSPGSSSLTADANFHVSCRTVRCKLPNVDPEDGTRHRNEPDRSLRKHRNVDSGAPLSGCLGMQLCPMFEDAERTEEDDLRSWLEVGMDVDVLLRGPHHYIKQ